MSKSKPDSTTPNVAPVPVPHKGSGVSPSAKAKRKTKPQPELAPEAEPLPLYCATDNEMFSSLMSAPQHFNINAVLEMGRQRGILYSREDDREYIIDQLSTQNFSYDQMRLIQQHFEYRGRGEKSQVIRIDHAFTVKEIQEVTNTFREGLRMGEKIFAHADGPSAYDIDLHYIETDFSMVSLRQRQRREARIRFEIIGSTTVITLPATRKAFETVGTLQKSLSTAKAITPKVEQIVLAGLTTAGSRTKFFVELITGMKDFTLVDVVRVRVEQAEKHDKTLLDDASNDSEQDHPEEDEKMLFLVRRVALHGENLLQSSVYQDLRKRGYYITSVRWRARLTVDPYPVVEFDASFDDAAVGGRFRFSVLGWFPPTKTGAFRKVIAPLPDDRKRDFLHALDVRSIALYRACLGEKNKVAMAGGLSK